MNPYSEYYKKNYEKITLKAQQLGEKKMNDFIPQEPSTGRVGLLQLRVGTFWAFREACRPGENDDLAMFRLIRERNHYKKWSYILAAATAMACILAAVYAP